MSYLRITNKFDVLITHSTKFHADDVFSTAFLKMINPNAKVIRTLNSYEESCKALESNLYPIVYDIGFGNYDHHQKDAEVRPNGVKYAAFGLLWREFGDWDKYPDFDKDFVQKIDEHDNGGEPFEISRMIGRFNPTILEDEEELEGVPQNVKEDLYFNKAVSVATEILKGYFAMYDEIRYSKDIVEKGTDLFSTTSPYNVLILPKYCNYIKHVLEMYPMVNVVVYPSKRGVYNAQVMPISDGVMTSKWTFPEEYCGKREADLPEDVTFVHNSGFLLAANTIQTAVKYARLVVEKK